MAKKILRSPYKNMIAKAKKEGRYRVIEGEELAKARTRINKRCKGLRVPRKLKNK